MKRKSIRKPLWSAYWKLHDKRKQLRTRLKGYLDGLPPKTRRRIVLSMLAAFAVLALYTFGKAVYDIGRNDGRQMEIGHIKEFPPFAKPTNNNHFTPYYNNAYGTDED